jgi:hypothetical protein
MSQTNNYDLVPSMAAYLDVHMIVPLVEHLAEVSDSKFRS